MSDNRTLETQEPGSWSITDTLFPKWATDLAQNGFNISNIQQIIKNFDFSNTINWFMQLPALLPISLLDHTFFYHFWSKLKLMCYLIVTFRMQEKLQTIYFYVF